jgi:heptosyltransferase-3
VLNNVLKEQGRRLYAWRRDRRADQTIAQASASVITQLKERKMGLSDGSKLIGILLTEHFGDIVACEPVVSWLRQQNPDAFIVWLTRPEYADLIRYHPEINDLIEIGSISEGEYINRSRVLDEVVDLHLNGKPCVAYGRLHRKTVGDPTINTENYYHRGPLLHALGLSAGLPRIDTEPRVFVSEFAESTVKRLPLPLFYLVVHTQSRERDRNWRVEYWNEFVGTLIAQTGATIVEVGSDAVLKDRGGVLNLCGKLSLLETAAVIRRASYFVGIDSGPAHFANAFRVPSVILLGRYRAFDRYLPYTGFLQDNAALMVIQWPDSASEIPVSEVMHRLESLRPSCGWSK